MNGDLISREALKKQVKELLDLAVKRVYDTPSNSPCYRIYVVQENERARLIDLIDNAPSVETDIKVVAKDAYEQGYTDGWKERFGEPDERPQGEWITDNLHNTICDNCGGIRRDNRVEHIAFCNKCGAKMKGGADNEHL